MQAKDTTPFNAFAIVCLIPLTVLVGAAFAASYSIPSGEERLRAEAEAAKAERAASVPNAVPLEAMAQEDGGQDDAATGDADQAPDLDQHMDTLQDGMKALRRMIGKEDKQADALKLCAELQAASLASLAFEPEMTRAIDDKVARTESRVGYQRRMVEVYDTLLQLELAFTKGDDAQQKELYKALGKQKQSGHDAYQ